MMKFLLVTTTVKNASKFWTCQETTPIGSFHPPVDLASIAATIISKGEDAKILDLRLCSNPFEKYNEFIGEYKPNAVITNLATTFALQDYLLLKKTPAGIKKIVFGTHSSFCADECFAQGVDFVLLGDPEACILELIAHTLDGEVSKGVLTRNAPKKTPLLLEDLDSLPFPTLELLNLDKYYSPMVRSRKYSILLSQRGCGFNCTFCFIPNYFGRKVRKRSAANVVAEMKHDLEHFGIDEFFFIDPTFNFNHQRVIELCNAIMSGGLKVKWACQNRVHPFSEEMAKKMAEAGCIRILFGVEDPALYDELKKATTMEQNIAAFKLCKKYGIKTVALTMLFDRSGLTEKEYEKYYFAMIKKLDADAFQCNVAIPFPGTQFFDDEKKRGKLSFDWSLYDPNGQDVLPYATKLDLIKLKNRIYAKAPFYRIKTVIKTMNDMNLKGIATIGISYLKHMIKSV